MRIYEVRLRAETDDHMSAEEVSRQIYDAMEYLDFSFDVQLVERRYASLEAVEGLAVLIHGEQTDKGGAPYIEHVRAVSAGLEPFSETLQMAGLLHDAIEDGDGWTAERLISWGVDPKVVGLVDMVTNVPGQIYPDKITMIAGDYEASLLKIADNAHNSREDRLAKLDEKTQDRLRKKYRRARKTLCAAIPEEDLTAIFSIVNPGLLAEVHNL